MFFLSLFCFSSPQQFRRTPKTCGIAIFLAFTLLSACRTASRILQLFSVYLCFCRRHKTCLSRSYPWLARFALASPSCWTSFSAFCHAKVRTHVLMMFLFLYVQFKHCRDNLQRAFSLLLHYHALFACVFQSVRFVRCAEAEKNPDFDWVNQEAKLGGAVEDVSQRTFTHCCLLIPSSLACTAGYRSFYPIVSLQFSCCDLSMCEKAWLAFAPFARQARPLSACTTH